MSSYGSYTPADASGASGGFNTYSVPLGPTVADVLAAEPEHLALSLAVPDPRVSDVMDQIAGVQGDDSRWHEILRAMPGLHLATVDAQIEKADVGHHRMGYLLKACFQAYEKLPAHGEIGSPGFYKWLNALPEWQCITMMGDAIRFPGAAASPAVPSSPAAQKPAVVSNEHNLRPSLVRAFVKGVAYLDAATRPSYRVTFEEGRAMYRGGKFDTSDMKTVFSGKGFAIWVMGEDFNMYAGSHIYGELHHSSFFGGEDIKAGGEIRAVDGNIEFLSAKSGHYVPPMQSLLDAVRALQTVAPRMDPWVLVWRVGRDGKTPELVKPDTLMANHVLYASWGDLNENERLWLKNREYDRFPRG